jgi:hypothetical protein
MARVLRTVGRSVGRISALILRWGHGYTVGTMTRVLRTDGRSVGRISALILRRGHGYTVGTASTLGAGTRTKFGNSNSTLYVQEVE